MSEKDSRLNSGPTLIGSVLDEPTVEDPPPSFDSADTTITTDDGLTNQDMDRAAKTLPLGSDHLGHPSQKHEVQQNLGSRPPMPVKQGRPSAQEASSSSQPTVFPDPLSTKTWQVNNPEEMPANFPSVTSRLEVSQTAEKAGEVPQSDKEVGDQEGSESGSPQQLRKKKTGLIIGIVLGLFLLIAGAGTVVTYFLVCAAEDEPLPPAAASAPATAVPQIPPAPAGALPAAEQPAPPPPATPSPPAAPTPPSASLPPQGLPEEAPPSEAEEPQTRAEQGVEGTNRAGSGGSSAPRTACSVLDSCCSGLRNRSRFSPMCAAAQRRRQNGPVGQLACRTTLQLIRALARTARESLPRTCTWGDPLLAPESF